MPKPTESTISAFKSLISDVLFDNEIRSDDFPTNVDWKELIRFAEIHTVRSIVIEAISRLPQDKQPNDTAKNKLNEAYLQNIQTHAIVNDKLCELVNLLNANGIDSVLLKGQGVAAYYSIPEMRHCGDIDLYVGVENFDKAASIINEKYPHCKGICGATHYHFEIDNYEVEIHRYAAVMSLPQRNKKFQKWIKKHLCDITQLQSLNINSTIVRKPSVYFDAIYVFYHTWYHLIHSGVGLRQLYDWLTILHKCNKDIDYTQLRSDLIELNLLKGWQILGYVAVNHIRFPKEEMPLYSEAYTTLGDKAYKIIMECGNFGKYSSDAYDPDKSLPIIIRKARTFRAMTKHYLKMWKFTPAELTSHILRSISSAITH